MTIEAQFNRTPPPSEAHSQHYVELNSTDIPELPVGDERYAELTYGVNSPTVNSDGQALVHVSNLTKTAFGEVSIAANEPFIQATAAYNLIPANFREYSTATGTTGAESGMFKVTTGTSLSGYGAIQSFRALNYKAGEGGLARFTGVFESSAANSWQGVGLVNLGDELSFGFNGLEFGTWHRYGGVAEVRTLTITGNETGPAQPRTSTLILDGDSYTVTVDSGTVEDNAHEIATQINNDIDGWNADQLDGAIIISPDSDGPKDGTFSYTADDGNSVGVFARTTTGITKTSDFTKQSEWNVNTASWLDPTKGNVYEIRYQYLGFGALRYYVEDPETGDFILVHNIKYANNNTVPSLGNPSLKCGVYAVNFGNTTDLAVYVGSFGLFMQGKPTRTRNPRAAVNSQTVDSDFTNIISLRNRRTYNGYINQLEATPNTISLANEATKDVEVEVRVGADNVSYQDWNTAGENLIIDLDTTSGIVSGGTLLGAYSLAGGDSILVDLTQENIRIPPSLQFSIAAKTDGPSAVVTAAVNWYEDL